MARTKKTDESTVDVASTATVMDASGTGATPQLKKETDVSFRQAVIDLGVELCEDVHKGILKKDESILNAITNLYMAVKS